MKKVECFFILLFDMCNFFDKELIDHLMNCFEIMTGWLVQSHFFCSWKFLSRRVRDQIRGFRQIGDPNIKASMQEVKEMMRMSSSFGRDCSLEGFEQEQS